MINPAIAPMAVSRASFMRRIFLRRRLALRAQKEKEATKKVIFVPPLRE